MEVVNSFSSGFVDRAADQFVFGDGHGLYQGQGSKKRTISHMPFPTHPKQLWRPCMETLSAADWSMNWWKNTPSNRSVTLQVNHSGVMGVMVMGHDGTSSKNMHVQTSHRNVWCAKNHIKPPLFHLL